MKNDYLKLYNEVFEEYYERHHNDIFRFAMVKTRNRDQALDITQETFVKFWEYLKAGNEVSNHRALLYRITRNLVIDGYRKKQDVLLPDYSEIDELSNSFNPEQQMIDHIDGEYALKLLDELPELIREIVSLRFLQDLSVTEIAAIVQKDPKTVSVYLHRGIKKLRELITSYES
jgi:RNA polymerase sigma-70 factor (ECF subfamily)